MSAAETKEGRSQVTQLAKQAVADVIRAIIRHRDLVALRQAIHIAHDEAANNAELEAEIKEALNSHFASCGNDQEKVKLYRRIILILAPDKLRNRIASTLSENPGLSEACDYLVRNSELEAPFKSLAHYKTAVALPAEKIKSFNDWIGQVATHTGIYLDCKTQKAILLDEKKGKLLSHVESLRDNLVKEERQKHGALLLEHTQLSAAKGDNKIPAEYEKLAEEHIRILKERSDALNNDELITQNAKSKAADQLSTNITNSEARLRDIFPGLIFVLGMKDSLDRYFQPLRFLSKLIAWSLMGPLGIAVVLLGIALQLAVAIPLLVLTLIRGILNSLMNLATTGAYNKQMNSYFDKEVVTPIMDNIRAQNPNLGQMTNEGILKLLEGQPEGSADHTLADQIGLQIHTQRSTPFPLFVFLKLSFAALGRSLISPPKAAGWVLLWLLTWPLRLALGLALTLVNLAPRLVYKAIEETVGAIMKTAILAAVVVTVLTLFVLNLPLYVLVDFPRALGRGFSNMARKFRGAENGDQGKSPEFARAKSDPRSSSTIPTAAPGRSPVAPRDQRQDLETHGTPTPKLSNVD